MYTCKYCFKEFETKNKLGGHVSHCLDNPKNSERNLCEFCGKEFYTKKSYTQHVNHCSNNPDKKIYNEASLFEEPQNCKYCGKSCKNSNSLRNHERLCKCNPDRQILAPHQRGGWPKGKPGWSKGLTKETDTRVANCSKQLIEYYKAHEGIFKGKHHTPQTIEILRNIALENEHHNHFRRRTTYTYKSAKFQSSYELAVAMDLDKYDVKWVQPKKLPYVDNNNKKHYYFADLYLPEYDVYLDPKNDYLIENVNPYFGYSDVQKITWVMEQNNVTILILDKDSLTWDKIKSYIFDCK